MLQRVQQLCQTHAAEVRTFAGFWSLGVLNNSAYVIMIAGANEISSGAVGAVYLCAIGPTILVKLTAPYWFHLVPYSARVWAAAALMVAAYTSVALSRSLAPQLAGVALVALQGGLGEYSMLALCARYHSQSAITAWSSGTGFAGLAGYAWVAVLHQLMRLSFTATLLAANITAALWLLVYYRLLPAASSMEEVRYQAVTGSDRAESMQQCMLDAQHSRASSLELALSRRPSRDEDDGGPSTSGSAAAASGRNAMGGRLLQQPPPQQEREREQCRQRADSEAEAAARQLLPQSHVPSDAWREVQQPPGSCGHAQGADVAAASSSAAATASATLTMRQRLHHTAALWPYMVPLFAVYFAEYAMQAGTWTAIGFPVTSEEARRRFYLAANSCYQAGVFISRSSGLLFQAGRGALWAMPGAQCLLLAAFFWDAATHWWYNWLLMGPCFAVGLLGGAVYVNAFTLISREVAPELREFSLGAACVADSLGIAAADACSILLQGCLFRLNGLSGAAFKCG